jgi:hypothetical protein
MSFLRSIPVWGWFDIRFNLLVLAALAGETKLILGWLFPETINDILPIGFKHEKWKKRFEWLLIIGIAGEIAYLPFSIFGTASAKQDASKANERASSNELQVAQLKLELLQTSNSVAQANAHDYLIACLIEFFPLLC